jgi:Tfp pilus assembly protein FimT
VTLIPILIFIVVVGILAMLAFRGWARRASRDQSGPRGRTPAPGNLRDREVG